MPRKNSIGLAGGAVMAISVLGIVAVAPLVRGLPAFFSLGRSLTLRRFVTRSDSLNTARRAEIVVQRNAARYRCMRRSFDATDIAISS